MRSTVRSPYMSMKRMNASFSESWLMTQECAIVPASGRPKARPASTSDVPLQPPMNAARPASAPASAPWARRAPSSNTGRPAAARTTRDARLATDVWNNTVDSSAVSTICPSMRGAVTRSSGSFGKTGSPSATAQTSPLKRNPGR